jgi:hypothetical protein
MRSRNRKKDGWVSVAVGFKIYLELPSQEHKAIKETPERRKAGCSPSVLHRQMKKQDPLL